MPEHIAGFFLTQLLQAIFELLLKFKGKQVLLTLLCGFGAGALTAWLGSTEMAPWAAAGAALLCILVLSVRWIIRDETAGESRRRKKNESDPYP